MVLVRKLQHNIPGVGAPNEVYDRDINNASTQGVRGTVELTAVEKPPTGS